MAQRRMFSKEVTTSDLFVDMPSSSQLLYFHLGMEADDEGFIGNAKMLSRAYSSNNDDLKLLEAKGFIIIFPSGVTVVKDWNLNNKIRKDRAKTTIYTEEKTLLTLDSKGSYLLGNQVPTIPQPNDNQMSAQDSIGKDRLGEIRIEKERIEKSNNVTKNRNEVQNSYVEKEQEKESNKDINKKQDTDVLFDNYFQIFSNFTKGIKPQPRVDAMHAFAELPPEQRDKALIGANNYVTWYQNSGNDIQYSKNAAVFLKDLIFIDYQEMPEDKSGYDPELGF